MSAGTPSEKTREMQRKRWRAMRLAGVPAKVARAARGTLGKFQEAMRSVGKDPENWPHLNVHVGPGRWSTYVPKSKHAEFSRYAYRRLKGAGMGAAHAIHWCRSEVSFHYAMRAISRGESLPLMPSEVKNKQAVLRERCQDANQATMSAE
jgi:hypothetical protein